MNLDERLKVGLEAVFKAGRLTLGYFNVGTAVDTKTDKTPVTRADREAESLIRAEILRAFPGDTILGEEQGLEGSSTRRWVIDPIDGTKSFVAGVPLYSNLLAYEVDGEPLIGIAYFPALDEMVYAVKDKGCLWNGRPASVSSHAELAGSMLVCGSLKTFVMNGNLDRLVTVSENSLALRTWCDAYGHVLVATGRADAMLDPIVNHWDVAAMRVIVEEAGGKFTDFRGNRKLGPNAIAGNPAIHQRLVEAFNA